jgi:hypothetical protein
VDLYAEKKIEKARDLKKAEEKSFKLNRGGCKRSLRETHLPKNSLLLKKVTQEK